MNAIVTFFTSLFCPSETAWPFGDYLVTKKHLIGPGEPGKRLVLALRDVRQVTFDIGADFPVFVDTRDKTYNLDFGTSSAAFMMSIAKIAPHIEVCRLNRVTRTLDISFSDGSSGRIDAGTARTTKSDVKYE